MQPAGQDSPTEHLEAESTTVESDGSIDMYGVSR